MRRATLLGACWLVLALPVPAQQAPATDAQTTSVHAYEIVSIKPHKAQSTSGGMRNLPDGFAWTNIPLSSLVRGSYGIILDNQVSGMPDWAEWEKYDIVAKADADTAASWEKLPQKVRWAEEQPMMRSILADRCQFKSHQETRELPVYDLVIAKGGLKVKEALANETPLETMTRLGEMSVHAMPMGTIAQAFTNTVGRMIIDKTGLGDKKFDFELKWMDDRGLAEDEAPSLITAFEEQLGLKLVPAKAPVEVLIIDHMERPSPN